MALLVDEELRESSAVIASLDCHQIEAIAEAMITSLRQGGRIIFFGNGGSAADAMHLAAELSGRYLMERPAMDGIALSSLSSITGIGNDYGYERVFVRQLEACARAGDVAVGLSTSGTSKNVVLALTRAKELGLVTASFTGSGGTIKELVDHPLIIPSTRTPRIQEAYLCAGHIICGLVERGMFGRRAVFIDRDDTIVQDVPYCSRPEDLRLFPGVGESMRLLNEAGYLTVLVTNQSGIGRGYFDEEMLERIHVKLRKDLAADGARLDAIYYCPHRPDEGCGCRKPATGMLERAVRDLGIDLRSSCVIGDTENDVAMGQKVGCRCIRVSKDMDFNQAVRTILGSK
ncbi:MAG: HAD-IIIA family hydrolase [Methanomassiliicoccus sp.]|nr:HAD-IIIA family hydrolase [Methanomassiliicoccus sp.]